MIPVFRTDTGVCMCNPYRKWFFTRNSHPSKGFLFLTHFLIMTQHVTIGTVRTRKAFSLPSFPKNWNYLTIVSDIGINSENRSHPAVKFTLCKRERITYFRFDAPITLHFLLSTMVSKANRDIGKVPNIQSSGFPVSGILEGTGINIVGLVLR